MYAMAYHESGGFSSNIFRANNNLYGMKFPTARQTTAKGKNQGYAVYKNQDDSVQDLLLWMDYVNFNMNVKKSEDFVYELKSRNYFEDSVENYLKGIKNGLDKYYG